MTRRALIALAVALLAALLLWFAPELATLASIGG